MIDIYYVEPSDMPEHIGDWIIAWGGWRTVANQMVVFGFWIAKRSEDDYVYSTTLSVSDRAKALYVLDLTWQEGWPKLTMASAADEREAVKARARAVLLQRISE